MLSILDKFSIYFLWKILYIFIIFFFLKCKIRITTSLFSWILFWFLQKRMKSSIIKENLSISLMNPLEIPHLTRYVNDFSHIFSEDQKNTLDALFSEHEMKTTEQVVTVFIPHREGNELLDIWLKLFNENWIGQKNLNNGLLLIVSTEEKKLRIIVGKGLELKYTEMVCRDIVENHLRPLLNAGKYEEMVTKLREVIFKEKYLVSSQKILNPFYLLLWSLFTPFIFIFIIIITIFFLSGWSFLTAPSWILVPLSCIIFFLIFSCLNKWKKLSLKIFSLSLFILFNILHISIFPLNCQIYNDTNLIKRDCSRIIFGYEFKQIGVIMDYTESYKTAHPEKFSSSSDSSSSDSSSSFDGWWGSSNGGGYGD